MGMTTPRMRGRIQVLALRLIVLTVFTVICVGLTRQLGLWLATALWVAGIGIVCGVVGVGLRRAKMGQVSPINYLAGMLFIAGYRIGHGKLMPIILSSWLAWSLIGVAAIIVTSNQMAATAPHALNMTHSSSGFLGSPTTRTTLLALIYISWLVDGAALARLLYAITNFRQGNRAINPALIMPNLVLIGIILASVLLTFKGGSNSRLLLAFLISGGPPLVVGGAFLLFMLVMLTVGRHTRWN